MKRAHICMSFSSRSLIKNPSESGRVLLDGERKVVCGPKLLEQSFVASASNLSGGMSLGHR